MNILVIANGMLRNIPEYLEQNSPGNQYFVISDECPLYPHMDYKHFRACTFGTFSDNDRYANLPLDSQILKTFSDCEMEVLKMMERYEFYRGLYSYDARVNLYHTQLKYWLNYLRENAIDAIIFNVIPHVVFDFILYRLAKWLGLKTVMFYRITIIVNRNVSIYAAEDLQTQIPRLSDRYRHHLENPQEAEVSSRMESYYSLRDTKPGKTFTGVIKRPLAKYLSLASYYHSLSYRWRYMREWSRYLSASDLFNRVAAAFDRARDYRVPILQQPELGEPYVYVALHYQPECSTSPMGGVFVHQDLMINMLMRFVPKDWKILIKGHLRDGLSPVLAARLRFDERTFVVDANHSSIQLVKQARAVATVTGTAGFEAFMNKVPVLMFGSYFYQHAPGVFKIETNEDIAAAIKVIYGNNALISDSEIAAFLKALDDVTVEGWVDNRYQAMSKIDAEENARRIASLAYCLIGIVPKAKSEIDSLGSKDRPSVIDSDHDASSANENTIYTY